MNQVLNSKGYSLFYYVVLFGAAISAFSPLFFSLGAAESFFVAIISLFLALFSFSRTSHGLRFISFAREAARELKKVTWPKKAETQQSVIAVVLCVLVAAIFFWTIDSIVIKILEWVLFRFS